MDRYLFLTTLAFFFVGTFGFLKFDLDKEVTYRLYTVNNKDNYKDLGPNAENVDSSGFDFNKNTKIVTHGFLNNGSGESCIALKDAYLQHQDVNVIIVDYKKIALDMILTQPNDKIEQVGEHVAKFIDTMIGKGLDKSKTHLIGHSLGAHVLGNAARNTKKGKVARVTGLDPGFMIVINEFTLSKDVADFVDVIHTCMGVYGMTTSAGTADFYPNGGWAMQPNCVELGGVTCSHYEAVWYMVRSIADPKLYPAHSCGSEDDFNDGKCKNNEVAYMGEAAAPPAKGDYYLTTKAN